MRSLWRRIHSGMKLSYEISNDLCHFLYFQMLHKFISAASEDKPRRRLYWPTLVKQPIKRITIDVAHQLISSANNNDIE